MRLTGSAAPERGVSHVPVRPSVPPDAATRPAGPDTAGPQELKQIPELRAVPKGRTHPSPHAQTLQHQLEPPAAPGPG